MRVQKSVGEDAHSIVILKDVDLASFPTETPPVGLSRERIQYLYKEIRELCDADVRDIVCPEPAPVTRTGQQQSFK